MPQTKNLVFVCSLCDFLKQHTTHTTDRGGQNLLAVQLISSMAQCQAVHEAQAAEAAEIDSLYDLFGADRGSAIPVGLYVKFEVSRENRDKAALARLQRQERDRIRQEKAQQLHEATQERRARVQQRSGKSACELTERNLETGRQVRACKAEWDAERDKQKQQLQEETNVKADVARRNASRLDQLEFGYAVDKQQKAATARSEHILKARNYKMELMAKKKERALAIRAESSRAVSSRVTEVELSKRQQADEKRITAAQGKALKHAEEQERLRKMAASRARTLETHQNAALAKEEMLRLKREEGQRADRSAGAMVSAAKNTLLHTNQQKRLEQFTSRFVSAESAALFDSSQFRHYYQMDQAAEDEIAASNTALFKRIKAMHAITDNDVTDDATGAARVVAAAAAKARRDDEANKITEQNAEMQRRLKAVKGKVEVDVSEEKAMAVRAKAHAAAKARRDVAAAKLAQQNKEMYERLKEIKAVTDDDMLDDVFADGQTAAQARKKAAQNSKAKKEADAAAQATKIAALRKKVNNVVARTDDDVLDDVRADGRTVGGMRMQAAVDSKARKAAEADKLASENAELQERLKNTTAKIDDGDGLLPKSLFGGLWGGGSGSSSSNRQEKPEPKVGDWMGGWGWGGGAKEQQEPADAPAAAEAEAALPETVTSALALAPAPAPVATVEDELVARIKDGYMLTTAEMTQLQAAAATGGTAAEKTPKVSATKNAGKGDPRKPTSPKVKMDKPKTAPAPAEAKPARSKAPAAAPATAPAAAPATAPATAPAAADAVAEIVAGSAALELSEVHLAPPPPAMMAPTVSSIVVPSAEDPSKGAPAPAASAPSAEVPVSSAPAADVPAATAPSAVLAS